MYNFRRHNLFMSSFFCIIIIIIKVYLRINSIIININEIIQYIY